MPPLKTYMFQHKENENILITIKAYTQTHAYDLLYEICKEPTNYEQI